MRADRAGPNERGEYPKLQRIFTDWCIAVAAGDIKRPGRRGRPKKDMRDELICMAMEKYRDRALDGEAVSDRRGPRPGGRRGGPG